MCNRLMVLEIILGFILTITTIPVKAQTSRLIKILETGPREVLEVDQLFNDPYSPIVVYPPPPGITYSTTTSTEPTTPITSTTHSTANNAIPISSISSHDESNIINPEPIGAAGGIQFKLDETHPLFVEVNSVTESVSTTEGIDQKKSTAKEVVQDNEEIKTTVTAVQPQPTTDGPKMSEDANMNLNKTDEKEMHSPMTTPTKPMKVTRSTTTAIPKTRQCTTPIGKNGECKDIRQCASLLNLLMREPLLVENKLYLQRSQCGLENQTVLVCCPDNVPPPLVSPKLSLLPKPPKCGTMKENRIYGGYHTEIDSFSWMALLEYSRGENDASFYCGGALINDRYVLTAAHCVKNLPETLTVKSVRLGEWDISTDMDCFDQGGALDCSDPVLNVAVEEVIPHKDFLGTAQTPLHDIALLRLSTRVNRTDFIEPICLPFGENTLHAFDDQALDMVGWGVTPKGLWNNIKQRTNAYVIQLDNCRRKYAGKNITLEATQFCVEGRIVDDMCRIDSGGALISFDTSNRGLGSYYIAGVQSFQASDCSVPDFPGVYTRVADYLDWILENIRE